MWGPANVRSIEHGHTAGSSRVGRTMAVLWPQGDVVAISFLSAVPWAMAMRILSGGDRHLVPLSSSVPQENST